MKYKIGGMSVRGSYHAINQDAFGTRGCAKGKIVVLADGLGSKEHSQVGAKALCRAVAELATEYKYKIEDVDKFLTDVHSLWIKKLKGYNIGDCCCTALFVCLNENEYVAGQLGDGIVSVVTDGSCRLLLDNKDDFINYTYALSENLDLKHWKIVKGNYKKFQGAYLSSDGVEIADSSFIGWENFINDFIRNYNNDSKKRIQADIHKWLCNWPGIDDKTIVFIL